MARARVLSFMTNLKEGKGSPTENSFRLRDGSREHSRERGNQHSPSSRQTSFNYSPKPSEPPPPLHEPQIQAPGAQRVSARPMSMVGGYQAPIIPVLSDTVPELAPVFTLLNSHANKLYQEGYFLKLNDLDSHGRPYPDRLWTESFAQLVGTVLSLWDAAELDAAGEDGEVAPTFINLSDASIKMIESLPTRSGDTQPLTNVLSVSTAGKNRYLFHFSTFNALTQWTAGIRLAMFENSCLQEAYTGSLIAGKGRGLNNIKTIMEKTRFKTEEWTRVRFGAGTPWRRCWCVISPPDEKELQAAKKQSKKKSAYDRGTTQLKGDIKFYDTRKVTKKTRPIATIRDAFAAYAIYPQSKALIDQSTLIKIEAPITIHTEPEVTTEGFVFVMPEVRPAVTGFEMMLRFIFPIFDVFILYGRPTRLVPETRSVQSLMFGMPKDRRQGYLEIFDVVTLINTQGSQGWSEREWKKQLKQLTLQRLDRMAGMQNESRRSSQQTARHGHRNSLPSRGGIRFKGEPMRSTPSLVRDTESDSPPPPPPPPHAESAPPVQQPFPPPSYNQPHQRSVSDVPTSPRQRGDMPGYAPSRLSHEQSRSSQEQRRPSYETSGSQHGSTYAQRSRMPIDSDNEDDTPPVPPKHMIPMQPMQVQPQMAYDSEDATSEDSERPFMDASSQNRGSPANLSEQHRQVGPVAAPPAFSKGPGQMPTTRPNAPPELRRANSRMSSTTLSQLAAAGNIPVEQTHNASSNEQISEERGLGGVNDDQTARGTGMAADNDMGHEGMMMAGAANPASQTAEAEASTRSTSRSPARPSITESSQQSLQAPSQRQLRSASPLSQATSISEPNVAGQPSNSGYDALRTHLPMRPMEDRPGTASSASSVPGPRMPRMNSRNSRSLSRKPLPSHSPARSSISQHPPRTTSVYMEDAPPLPGEITRRDSADDHHVYYASDSEEDASADSISPPVNRDQPRSGVLKTVGDVDSSQKEVVIGDAHYRPPAAQPGQENFNVDFGSTQALDPSVPPRKPIGTAHSSAPGAGQAVGQAAEISNGSPNLSIVPTPEQGRSREASTERTEEPRTQAWQPGSALASSEQTTGLGLTPEQYVEQRAAAPRAPAPYAQQRQNFTSPPGYQQRRTPPPGASPNPGAAWSPRGGHHPQSPRPGSRGHPQSPRPGSRGGYAQSYGPYPSTRLPGNFPQTPDYYDGGWEQQGEGHRPGSQGRGAQPQYWGSPGHSGHQAEGYRPSPQGRGAPPQNWGSPNPQVQQGYFPQGAQGYGPGHPTQNPNYGPYHTPQNYRR